MKKGILRSFLERWAISSNPVSLLINLENLNDITELRTIENGEERVYKLSLEAIDHQIYNTAKRILRKEHIRELLRDLNKELDRLEDA